MKKRILFFGIKYFPSRGGSSRVAENIISQLKDEFDISIYCYKNPAAKNHINGVRTIEFTPIAKGAFGAFIHYIICTIHFLMFEKPDVVHIHKTECAMFAPLLRIKSHTILTSHEAPYRRKSWNMLIRAYFRLSEWAFIYGSRVKTTISKPLADYYNTKYHSNVQFIANGTTNIAVSGSTQTDTKPYILFASRRLIASKGCHYLIDAVRTINCNLPVLVAGELKNTPYQNTLREKATGLDVDFIGFIEDLPTLLQLVAGSQLFVFPSEIEGMSIMLLEAASVGKPIVASDIPENRQIFDDSEVLYFKSADTADLALKLSYALTHAEAMQQRAQRAQHKVQTKYNWTTIARQYAALYAPEKMKFYS